MIDPISNVAVQGTLTKTLILDTEAKFSFESSDESVLPVENISLDGKTLTCVSLKEGDVDVTIKAEKLVNEELLKESVTFTISFVREMIDPSKATLNDPFNKTSLNFEYPAELKPLIHDAFWSHFHGGVGTEAQKILVVREQLVNFIVSIVSSYARKVAEQKASTQASNLAKDTLPYVKIN